MPGSEPPGLLVDANGHCLPPGSWPPIAVCEAFYLIRSQRLVKTPNPSFHADTRLARGSYAGVIHASQAAIGHTNHIDRIALPAVSVHAADNVIIAVSLTCSSPYLVVRDRILREPDIVGG